MKFQKILGASLLCASLLVSNLTVLAAETDQSLNINTQSEETKTQAEPTTDESAPVKTGTSVEQENGTSGENQTDAGVQETENGTKAEDNSNVGNTESTDSTENVEGTETIDNTETTEVVEETEQIATFDLSQYAGGRTITVDGNPKEWEGISTYTSSDANVAKWAVAQNDQYVYFYVQTNGGNQWGLPITSTRISISYENLAGDRSNGVGFAFENSSLVLKDNNYGNMGGTLSAFTPSSEKDKYEIEFAVPQSFFANHDYVLTYCGTGISSKDITVLNTLGEYVEQKPVYSGITIDGNFSDWDAVEKTQVNDGCILEAAVVFDGDWVYIYLKDGGNNQAFSGGERNHGVYELKTDTGRRTSFLLRQDGIQGIDGAQLSYSNGNYEIAIPASALKAYRSTISFGYNQMEPMISGITKMQGGSNISGSFSGITIDGNFGDWTNYPHTLIQYSTNGAYGDDADGALYVNNNTLYGHVKTYKYATEVNPYNPITIRFNKDDNQTISFYFVSVDGNGNVTWSPAPDTSGNSVKYYLVDVSGWHGASTLTELEADTYGNKILGEAYIRMGKGSDTEIEYQIDLEKLAAYISDSSAHNYKISATDMKTIQAQYINIGTQWIEIAGTSSGPVAGVVLSMSVAACVLGYRKRKEKGIV